MGEIRWGGGGGGDQGIGDQVCGRIRDQGSGDQVCGRIRVAEIRCVGGSG